MPHNCIHAHITNAVPPTDLQLQLNDEITMTVSWNSPDQSRVTMEGLHLLGYTVTCTNLPNKDHLVQGRVSDVSTLTIAFTGLQLVAFEYECCVSADYSNYHPKVCEITNIAPTVGPTTELSVPQEAATTELSVPQEAACSHGRCCECVVHACCAMRHDE